MAHIVIIGGGQAAASLLAKYRQGGGSDEITLLSSEAHLPYQRPPLSKAYLLGELEQARLAILAADWYSENKINVRLQQRVNALNIKEKYLELAAGERVFYDKCVIATGTRPRQLPASLTKGIAGIVTLRDMDDADYLSAHWRQGQELLVIGGGYIGLEAAAVARKLAMQVSVVEMQSRILNRVAAPATAAMVAQLHQDQGVNIETAVNVNGFAETASGIAVTLSTGKTLNVDHVLVGIGAIANDELAAEAGLRCDQGVVVDEYCRTNDPAVFAIGDCTRFPFRDQLVRLESVQNAADQGAAVAKTLLGEETRYAPLPWFWSDQYQHKLQIAGFNLGYDHTVVREGKKPQSHSIWYYQNNRFIAVDAINDPLAYALGRKMLGNNINPDPLQIADSSVDLKSLS